jgi:osmotically-inducible protein OsmY
MRWVKTFKSERSAEALEWAVRRALFGDGRLRDFDAPRIHIRATPSGEVALWGAVCSPETRVIAETDARSVDGVTSVCNELRTDEDVTKQMLAIFQADATLRGLAKDSVVVRGNAELRGTASNGAQVTAVKAVEAIDGVRGIDNHIQIVAAAAA